MQIKHPFYELIEYIEIRVQRIAIPYYSPKTSKFWGGSTSFGILRRNVLRIIVEFLSSV